LFLHIPIIDGKTAMELQYQINTLVSKGAFCSGGTITRQTAYGVEAFTTIYMTGYDTQQWRNDVVTYLGDSKSPADLCSLW
jgi:hypothetical protein